MASAGRHSELQAPGVLLEIHTIQISEGGCYVIYLIREFMTQIGDLHRLASPGIFQQSLLGSQFGAPNYPGRALNFYLRYMSEHPELRKGRRHLFILIKYSNERKEA